MLSCEDALKLIEIGMTSADFAEVFISSATQYGVSMLDGRVVGSTDSESSGIGVRLMRGTNVIYVHTSSNDFNEMVRLTKEASSAIRSGNESSIKNVELMNKSRTIPSSIRIDPMAVGKKNIIDYLKKGYDISSNYDERISSIISSYTRSIKTKHIINSEGLNKEETTRRQRMSFEVVATDAKERQTARIAPGTIRGFEFFEEYPFEEEVTKLTERALRMLTSGYAPSGKMPVVIGNGFGGVIFHEACGHALEATSVGIKASVFTDMIGKRIASPIVNARDNAIMEGEWGSYYIDDEGNSASNLQLIENGILKNYLVDKLGERRMGMKATGCARRQGYSYAPTSRMSNTYIENGTDSKEDIIKDTEYGLYAANMGGGSVDTATGEFNFAVDEGYIIRNGKICEPVRGATLVGKGSEVLMNIDKVGNDLKLAQGMCGSISGSVPTNVGQPTIRVSSILVGGRE